MKRIFAALFAGLMVVSMAACGQQATSQGTDAAATTEAAKTAETEVVAGGYTATQSPVVTDEVKALLTKATESLSGMGYTPVAYLGTQVVAGTNHLLLCKATPVTENPETTYALVTVYEDPDGNASIAEVQSSEAKAPVTAEDGTTLSGGYTETETPEVTDEAKAALGKACEGLTGASYEARALLATQVVAGTNYSLLCEITPVTANATSHYAIVTVYQDLDGNAEITETVEFNSGTNY